MRWWFGRKSAAPDARPLVPAWLTTDQSGGGLCSLRRGDEPLREGERKLRNVPPRRVGDRDSSRCKHSRGRATSRWQQSRRDRLRDRRYNGRRSSPSGARPDPDGAPAARFDRHLARGRKHDHFLAKTAQLRLFGNSRGETQTCAATGALIMCSRGSISERT